MKGPAAGMESAAGVLQINLYKTLDKDTDASSLSMHLMYSLSD